MTEEEKQNNPAYLRGRIEGLEAMIDALVYMLPVEALRSLQNTLQHEIAGTIQRRDASTAHTQWDMQNRSHFPPDTIPEVTLHADGFLQFTSAWADQIDERIDQKLEEDGFSILAASEAAIRQQKQQMDWQED